MKTLLRPMEKIASLVFAIGITLWPTASLWASCKECVEDQGYIECLLGCGVGDPDCLQITSCAVIQGVGCTGQTTCGSFSLVDPITATGTLALADRASVMEDAEGTAGITQRDGSVIYRLPCNATVVARLYSETTATTLQASTHVLTV
jgi:hypothetical protein